MTPEEFKKALHLIVRHYYIDNHDKDGCRKAVVNLMCRVLNELGYIDDVEFVKDCCGK